MAENKNFARSPKFGTPGTTQVKKQIVFRMGKLLLFYAIFYTVLGSVFAAMWAIFCQTLDDTKPKLQLDRSLIGSSPGMGFRPMSPDPNAESTLIWYKPSDPKIIAPWNDELTAFLEPYTTKEMVENQQNCDLLGKPKDHKVCEFKLTKDFAPCLREFSYGFESDDEGGPCIFLKLNKIFGWVPEYYNSTTTPQDMPKHLKDHIELMQHEGKHHVVWVDCAGEHPIDKENIGSIRYHPRGFHDNYFPFTNIKGYVSPVVAVHFENPKRNIFINVECKAWARNIVHDRTERRGMASFTLLIDTTET